MSEFKAPRDKVFCILRSCLTLMNWLKLVNQLLNLRDEDSSAEKGSPDATQNRGARTDDHDEDVMVVEKEEEDRNDGAPGNDPAGDDLDTSAKSPDEGDRSLDESLERSAIDKDDEGEEEEQEAEDGNDDEDASPATEEKFGNASPLAAARDISPENSGNPSSPPISKSENLSQQHHPAPVTRRPSADEFLPLLIWMIIRSRPRQLLYNLDYIAAVRAPIRLNGEPLYFFTHLQSAVSFVLYCDQKCFSGVQDSAEFDEYVLVCVCV